MDPSKIIEKLKASGNFRSIAAQDSPNGLLDLSSNDYLGLAQDKVHRRELLEYAMAHDLPLGSSASRLLSAHQWEYARLEQLLESLFPGRRCLMFNSGYHANTGIISAIADRDTLVVADRLVHASIIDGITLSRAQLVRFRHNDYSHLRQIMADRSSDFARVLIVAESVYSMDGDQADIHQLVDAKSLHPDAMLYIDEAHAFGVEGPNGRGCVAEASRIDDADVIVGTFGKALASEGAFAAVSPTMRDFLVNRARSLIFSTAIGPVIAAWTRLSIEKMLDMDAERQHLRTLGAELGSILGNGMKSHIQPFIVGDAARAVSMSDSLLKGGVKALPIRTPTVPPGTERLRFSLSAAIDNLELLKNTWEKTIGNET